MRKAKWEKLKMYRYDKVTGKINKHITGYSCSRCHYITITGKTKYCPGCGARMENE